MSTVTEGKSSKSDATKIEVGQVYSRHSFGTVVGVQFSGIEIKNTEGRRWVIDKAIVEDEFQFAEHVEGEQLLVTRTELVQLIMTLPRVAMTLTFTKKPDHKEAAANLSSGQGNLTDNQWRKLVKNAMEGESRTVKGYHLATNDEHGRLRFIAIGEGDSGFRLVDPRTINECIVNNTHYIVK